AADRVPGDHGHDGLGHAADLDVEVGHVEAADRLVRSRLVWIRARHIATARAAHALIAAAAERVGALASEDDHPDILVPARQRNRLDQLDDGLGATRVSDLRAVDGDLGDPPIGAATHLVANVLVLSSGFPGD